MKAIEDIIDAEIVEDIEFETPKTPRQQQIAELRHLLDVLEANPDVPMPYRFGNGIYDTVAFFTDDAAQAALTCKAIGGPWSKGWASDDR